MYNIIIMFLVTASSMNVIQKKIWK